jgi:hypothetical protein
VVPLANAELFEERLPNGKLVVVDAGHFVWEEHAAEYASLITGWVAYREAAACGPTAAVMSPATDVGGDEFEQ